MREILFRGKHKDTGEWVYWDVFGRITTHTGKQHILTVTSGAHTSYYYHAYQIMEKIDQTSIGQCTSMKDKNCKRIFEGDIVRVSWHAPRRDTVYEVYEVVYSKSGFFMKRNGVLAGQVSNYISPNVNMRCEIIGNIHDNPELIGGGGDG